MFLFVAFDFIQELGSTADGLGEVGDQLVSCLDGLFNRTVAQTTDKGQLLEGKVQVVAIVYHALGQQGIDLGAQDFIVPNMNT